MIIFSPGLEDLVQEVVSHCPVCTLSSAKKLHRQCGEVKNTVYATLQAVVCDYLYLPADKLQNKKTLLLADSCTGKVSQITICKLPLPEKVY